MDHTYLASYPCPFTRAALVKWPGYETNTYYACWLLVHLRDMVDLPETHSEVAVKFNASLAAKKITCTLSAKAIDQAQNNPCVKGA